MNAVRDEVQWWSTETKAYGDNFHHFIITEIDKGTFKRCRSSSRSYFTSRQRFRLRLFDSESSNHSLHQYATRQTIYYPEWNSGSASII
ncbi:hypothetical protein SCHPADRAFT_907633 [Schizopora paradoxa]|uniref:Uncharacterized protein n=1 Tax=Schizopora paradoxa TaxID=27342 RepID=A0A0H2RJH0_9AGAM|nr:hypothetical protein SCHPADRAFT_907633 [Schizopora paradoxa]